MSDFGAILIFSKKQGLFTNEDKDRIVAEITTVFDAEDLPEEGVNLVEWGDDELCFMYTEYYSGDDSDEIREFAVEEDLYDLESAIAEMSDEFKTLYTVEAAFEDW